MIDVVLITMFNIFNVLEIPCKFIVLWTTLFLLNQYVILSCLFGQVEDPADIESVRSAVSTSSGIKEDKPAHSTVKNDVGTSVGGSVARISPAAKLLIAEHGLDASLLKASGSHGTLLKGDVLAAIKSGKGSSEVSLSKEKGSHEVRAHASSTASSESKPSIKQSDSFEDFPNSQIRKVHNSFFVNHDFVLVLGPIIQGLWCSVLRPIKKIVFSK